MEKKNVKMEKKNVKMATIIFLFIYSIVALGKIQSNLAAPWWDNDYIYAGYVTAIGLASIAVHIKQRAIKITNGVKIVTWIISYVFLWGFIFIDFRFKSLISDNRFKMLYFIIFVSATAFWVNRLKCFKNFLKITYLVEVGFLLICFWLYRQKGEWIANLLTFFIGGRKEKIGYGGNANITGSLCFLAILMGNLLLEYASNITWKKIIHVLNIIIAYMLLTTSSRIAIICLVSYYVILAIWYLYKKPESFIKIIKYSLNLFIILSSIIILNAEKFSPLLHSMNRYYAVSYYIEALKMSRKWLTGIAYINYGKMPEFLYTYGLKSTFSESCYVDILVTSGILGCFWMIYFYYLLIKGALKSNYLTNNHVKVKVMIMFFCFIIYGIGEPVGFTDAYWISFAFLSLFFCFAFESFPSG